MANAVVIASWEGGSPVHLARLLSTMDRKPAGARYDLYLVMNGNRALPPEQAAAFRRVFVRENLGYNLSAWDHGWRNLPDHDHFLFLQDDCVILRRNWLRDFCERFQETPRCGLVGELLSSNVPWEKLIAGNPEPQVSEADLRGEDTANCFRFYRKTLLRWGVPIGDTACHLASLVHFTSRSVLEEVNGYPMGLSYREAIAAEIGFSRKIEAAGYRLVQLAGHRLSRIGHREWYSDSLTGRVRKKLFRDAPDRARRLIQGLKR